MQKYDVIVIGSGAAGMIAAITAARRSKSVLLLEKLSKIGAKLKATGGGRCNLTNTLSNEAFMASFGREGRFMTPALNALDHKALIAFFAEIGVEAHFPDGFRVFPKTHSSQTIITALEDEMKRLGVRVECSQKVEELLFNGEHVTGVKTTSATFSADNVVVATGGLGYPVLGAEGDGFELAKQVGHKITPLHPAMMPLKTKETWVENCRADTLPKVEMYVNLPKYKKLKAKGDLIFTKTGIRGPVVLDFSREITPLLSKFDEVPLLMNLTKGMNEEQIRTHIKNEIYKNQDHTTLTLLQTLLPEALSLELCKLAEADPDLGFNKQSGQSRDKLVKLLAWTPLTINGHEGFKMAMITRGGVTLKEIVPETMESKKMKGLFFCGEVMNLDGPCGGYNLQWSFASGYVAGHLAEGIT
ncbi:MAG: NAD(P)/FAD-dependent oxidoreductase [Sulfurimonadaceae bacterium]